MINVNDFKNGQTINYDGNLYQVLDFNHVKPGKGAAIVKAKLKNLRTGSIAEYTFNAGIKVPTAHVEKQKMQFLYADGDTYSFMNMETYEQVELNKKQIENEVKYLKEGLEVKIEEMDKMDAVNSGAECEFIEKYPDRVTVYTIGDNVSKELCGGPHVKNTNELGTFKIVKEEASSAGVRRIKAILEEK